VRVYSWRVTHDGCWGAAVGLCARKQVGMVRSDARRSRVSVIVKTWRVLVCSLLVLCVAAACGTPRSAFNFHTERRAADRLADADRYDDAIDAYTALSKKADTQ